MFKFKLITAAPINFNDQIFETGNYQVDFDPFLLTSFIFKNNIENAHLEILD